MKSPPQTMRANGTWLQPILYSMSGERELTEILTNEPHEPQGYSFYATAETNTSKT